MQRIYLPRIYFRSLRTSRSLQMIVRYNRNLSFFSAFSISVVKNILILEIVSNFSQIFTDKIVSEISADTGLFKIRSELRIDALHYFQMTPRLKEAQSHFMMRLLLSLTLLKKIRNFTMFSFIIICSFSSSAGWTRTKLIIF